MSNQTQVEKLKMNLQEFLFKKKGWGSSYTPSLGMLVISNLRSDMVDKKGFCNHFYQQITETLEMLSIRRLSMSIDLTEASSGYLLTNPDSDLAKHVDLVLTKCNNTVVFACEHTPLNFQDTYSLAKKIVAKYNLDSYMILSVVTGTPNAFITICAAEGDKNFSVNTSTKRVKESQHDYC